MLYLLTWNYIYNKIKALYDIAHPYFAFWVLMGLNAQVFFVDNDLDKTHKIGKNYKYKGVPGTQ